MLVRERSAWLVERSCCEHLTAIAATVRGRASARRLATMRIDAQVE